jgi:hypothetical protein
MKVISLTSIPSRFDYIAPTLISLLNQGADQVRLYIPKFYYRFPDWDGSLPDVPNGVLICRCDQDYGPATKILPACRDLRDTSAQILFCDDDCIIDNGWAMRLFNLQRKRNNQAIATYVRSAEGYVSNTLLSRQLFRAWQLPILLDFPYRLSRLLSKTIGTRPFKRRPFVIPGYGDIFFGAYGVVVNPDFFDDLAYDIPNEAWPVDDVWLSANLARRGIKIYCPWMAAFPRSTTMAVRDALVDSLFLGMRRQELNKAAAQLCQQLFKIWL